MPNEYLDYPSPAGLWGLVDSKSPAIFESDLSARGRSDHLERPFGGVLQLRAIIPASTSPVILGSTGSVSRFFPPMATSNPFSEYRCRMVCTV